MKELVEKLKSIQLKLKAPKLKDNKFGNYKYRSLEDIVEEAKPLLGEYGLVLTISDEVVCLKSDFPPIQYQENTKNGTVTSFYGGDRYYIRATATVTDGIDSIVVCGWAREADNKKGMDESQISGMASSYARKYALNGLFAIDDTQDADTQDNRQTESKAKPSTPQTPSKPAPSAGGDFNAPKVDNEKTQKLFDMLVEYYKTQETDRFKFNYDKFLKAVWSKYGKYPQLEAGAKKIKSEIMITDVCDMVEAGQ